MKKHVKMHLCIYRLLPNRLHQPLQPHRRKIVKMPRLKQEAQCKRGRFCNAEALQIRLSTKTQVAPRRPPPTLLMQLLLESRKLRLAIFVVFYSSYLFYSANKTTKVFYVNNEKVLWGKSSKRAQHITSCWGSKLKKTLQVPKTMTTTQHENVCLRSLQVHFPRYVHSPFR